MKITAVHKLLNALRSVRLCLASAERYNMVLQEPRHILNKQHLHPFMFVTIAYHDKHIIAMAA